MIVAVRERWSRWRDSRAAGPPINFQPYNSVNFGPGMGNQPSHSRLLRESLGIADTATRAIATRVSTLNPQVKTKRRVRDGTTVEETIDDHPLKMLLDRPHPNLTRAQLNRLTAQWIVTVGEAYWLKVGSPLNVPIELHPIPPTNIYPIVSNGVVEEYEVLDGNGKPSRIPAGTVIRFYFPDPENIWASEGYLGPEAITADSLKFSGQHLRRRYENNATPQSVLETGADATQFGKDEKERFAQEWAKKYHTRRGKDTDSPAILPMGYKLVEMAMQSGADVTPLLEFWRDEQLMGFFTPRSILGQVVSGDRSSAETNQYVFDRHAVKPVANLIADGCTLQLAADFDANLFVEFEEFVSDDKKFTLEQETADLVSKVRSVNQVRDDRGLDHVDWGEDPVSKIGEIPYDPEGFDDLVPDVPAALGDEDEPLDDAPRMRAQSYFTPDAEWQRQIAREKKFVPALLRAMRTIFRDQEKSVLQKLQEQADTPRARAVNPELLIDPAEWERMFAVRVEPIREAAFLETVVATVEGLGGEGAEFIFTDAMRNQLKQQGAQLVKQVNATTGKRIAQAVTEVEREIIAAELEGGVAAGQATDQIAKRIEGVFRVRRKEARTIARTEILKASQSAQLESYEVMEVEQKQWNVFLDDETRAAHISAENGGPVPVGESFDLDGEAADAPGIGAGGGALSAGNSINCRCFLTPVVG